MLERLLPLRVTGYRTRLARMRPIIDRWAAVRGLPLSWCLGIAREESGFRPWAQNNAGGDGRRGGSWGLFQLSLTTAHGLGYVGDTQQLLDADTNARWATQLIAELRDRYHNLSDVASAYNSGKPYALAPATTRVSYVPHVLRFAAEFSAELVDHGPAPQR